MHSDYLQTKVRTLRPGLHNFYQVYSGWKGSIFNRVENHNENGNMSVVLFIGNSDLIATKFKKKFILRGKRNKGGGNIIQIFGLVEVKNTFVSMQCFKYSVLITGQKPFEI